MVDLSRRAFMLAGTSSLMALSGGVTAQRDAPETDATDFQGVAHLTGPATARPAPGDPFFDDKPYYAYIYEDHTGARALLTQDDDAWQPLNYLAQQPVFSSADLPDPTNGTHTLEDRTAYVFNGFVTSPYGLELGQSTPLLGRHGSLDGFIHTGGATALTGTDAGFFARDLYVHAPAGTIFDLTADNTTEMLVESVSFSDAAGIAKIASLGSITGYRVPTFKGCNFEGFDAGLRFDGNPDKVFVWGSPLRGVTASGVTVFTLAGSSSAQIVDFADNYVKDVQPDTEVWRVEPGGSPSEVFQYRGTVHDTSVAKANILTGEADPTVEPYWVSDSYPLKESSVVGELSLESQTTTTINAQNTWYQVTGSTAVGNETERMVEASDGVLEYTGTKETNVHVTITATFTGANGDIYRFATAKNGTTEPASTMELAGGGQNAPMVVTTSAIEDLVTGDTVSMVVQNTSSTNDATFQAYTITLLGL